MSALKNKAIVRKVISTIAGHMPADGFADLGHVERDIAHANMHLGIGAQCKAIEQKEKTIAAIVDDIPEYYLERIVEFIKKDMA